MPGPVTPVTAWDALTPEQQAQLTPQAKKVLSMVPYRLTPSLRRGGIPIGGTYNPALIPGTTGSLEVNPNNASSHGLILHEALHALDYNTGRPSNALQFSEATRKALSGRYYAGFAGTGYTGGNFGSESHIPQDEAFAVGGQRGPAGIPPDMLRYYRNTFVLPPPPVGSARPVTPVAPGNMQVGVPKKPTSKKQKQTVPPPTTRTGGLRRS
jgi:hypothetical protein